MNIINNFSKHLFWDVAIADINQENNAKYVITKVLQYGLFEDWKVLSAYYGIDRIAKEALKIRDLDKKTAAFLALISDTPKHKFACYNTTPSMPKHWHF